MFSFFNKIDNRLKIKKAFLKCSFVLKNGKYNIRGNDFFIKPKDNAIFFSTFKIKSNNKFSYLLDKGKIYITPYKTLLMDDKLVFTFVKGFDRFSSIKKNIQLFANRLPYKVMSTKFDDDHNLIISDVVKGDQFNDEERLWMFVQFYFKNIKKKFFEVKTLNMCEKSEDVIFYPQHGDCHTKNIFWKDDKIQLIDADDINLYPLLYDVFYYIIASKHEEAFKLFCSGNFLALVQEFCNINGISYDNSFVDKYLASYIYYWVNQMNIINDPKTIHFYIRWFENADLSQFPMTSTALGKYKMNLQNQGIINEKR
ncbi:MAG: hypothetical protein K5765_03710 [Clostridia bacterium]|nr:hypothetical protein [Clostridia bacterium]